MRVLARVAFVSVFALGCAAAPPRASFGAGKQASAHACASADDCTLVSRTCCGHCGQPAGGDVRAVLASEVTPPSRCAGVTCPSCHAEPDPALVAYCAAGSCRVLDLHDSAISACNRDSDCIVRPRGCCDCGASAWVAVNARQSDAYARRVCQPVVACPQCVGPPPPAPAICEAAHCVLGPRRHPVTIDDLLAPGS